MQRALFEFNPTEEAGFSSRQPITKQGISQYPKFISIDSAPLLSIGQWKVLLQQALISYYCRVVLQNKEVIVTQP